jgi:hypothetical protein
MYLFFVKRLFVKENKINFFYRIYRKWLSLLLLFFQIIYTIALFWKVDSPLIICRCAINSIGSKLLWIEQSNLFMKLNRFT